MPKPRELHDKFFKKAKEEGYVARSAYKLLEAQERYRVIRPGDRVLDLGCAPGSWIQVAAKIVGAKGGVIRGGCVVGIDLQPVSLPGVGPGERGSKALPGVTTLVGDIFATSAEDLMAPAGGEAYGVVLSDMAPGTTGTPVGDHFRSVHLCRRVLDLLPRVMLVGGSLVMKVFEGEAYPELLKDVQAMFLEAKGLRPEATREVSREMFIVAKGFRGVDLATAQAAASAAVGRPRPARARGATRGPTSLRGLSKPAAPGAPGTGADPTASAAPTPAPLPYVKKPKPRGWGPAGSGGQA